MPGVRFYAAINDDDIYGKYMIWLLLSMLFTGFVELCRYDPFFLLDADLYLQGMTVVEAMKKGFPPARSGGVDKS